MQSIFVWLLLVCGCAAYFAMALHFFLRGIADPSARASSARETLGWLVPVIVCAAVQFRAAKLAGVSGSHLWLQVAGGGIGAPLAGFMAMLIVIFAIFSKAP